MLALYPVNVYLTYNVQHQSCSSSKLDIWGNTNFTIFLCHFYFIPFCIFKIIIIWKKKHNIYELTNINYNKVDNIPSLLKITFVLTLFVEVVSVQGGGVYVLWVSVWGYMSGWVMS